MNNFGEKTVVIKTSNKENAQSCKKRLKNKIGNQVKVSIPKLKSPKLLV